MKKTTLFIIVATIGLVALSVNWAISDSSMNERERRAMVDWRIDNMAYWMDLAEKGIIPYNAETRTEDAIYKGSQINAATSITEDSPDVPVTTQNSTQSENSVFVDPNDNMVVVNSNNSSSWPVSSIYGADYFYSFDSGETYDGSIQGAGGTNQGDPAVCIGTDGRWYIGFINNGGQGVSYSDDQGQSWTKVQVAPNPGQLADKNHMWIDRKAGSPYENYLYNAWTPFGSSSNGKIVVSRSTDRAETWSSPMSISNGTGGFHQGVNIQTGPNGEVYAIWAVTYGGGDEDAIGFAKSYDGGVTWETAYTAIDNIRGIRSTGVPQGNRANSFPVMAVDISDGETSGNIYIVWTNVGVPGINSGSDREIYMIKSEDEGETWGEPVRVNQDDPTGNKVQFFPWIACDASNGMLSVIFYDNRNSGSQTEAWVANSSNAGETWEDFRVSDVSFPLGPIPGFSGNYAGDYLGITAYNGMVYPCWGDNRSGKFLTYISPFETINLIAPFDLQAEVDQETGECMMTWQHDSTAGFQYYEIYRNDEFVGQTTQKTYTDQIPDYGYYNYKVIANYGGNNQSYPASDNVQWGSPEMVINPYEFEANVYINDSATQYMVIKNSGVLDLDFELSPFAGMSRGTVYEAASGGGDEYIRQVIFNTIDNISASENYADYTSQATYIKANNSYQIQVVAGNAYQGDQIAVWIDWDKNGVFDEDAIVLSTDAGNEIFQATINPIKGSKHGAIGMRVRLVGPGEELSAYGDSKYGEVEDYTLLYADWLSLNPEEGTIVPGDSIVVTVKFDATGLTTGQYDESVSFVGNDINTPFIRTYYTLNVTDLQISVSADPSAICEGESTQLSAMPVGGSGSYSYEWSSNPAGFESTDQNPNATPTENTDYFVAVNDGVATMYDTVSVMVYALPEVDLGADEILCGESEHQLDAGNPGSEYIWSTGETTQTIMATGNGVNSFWVEVTNQNSCSSSDTVSLNFVAIPDVDLGADTIICQSSSVTLDAGNPGSEYMWTTGETTQKITVNAENYDFGLEEFGCLVTTQYGCENSDAVTIEIKDCTGIDELSGSVSLQVFPNPSTGVFQLKIESLNNTTVNIKVLSISGKMVYQRDNVSLNGTYNDQIDISNLAEGVYSVYVTYDGNITTKKVIVRK